MNKKRERTKMKTYIMPAIEQLLALARLPFSCSRKKSWMNKRQIKEKATMNGAIIGES